MPREIEEKGFHVLIHTNISEDFREFRKMVNLMEEICDLAAPENQERANRLFDKVLEIAVEVVDASGSTNKHINPPKKR